MLEIKNVETVEAALENLQKRCTARTVGMQNVRGCLERLERQAPTKKWLEGKKFEFDPNAQRFPGAYKYAPESTHIFVRISKGKAAVSFERSRCSTTALWCDNRPVNVDRIAYDVEVYESERAEQKFLETIENLKAEISALRERAAYTED